MVASAHNGEIPQSNHDNRDRDLSRSQSFASASSLPMSLLPPAELIASLPVRSDLDAAPGTDGPINEATPGSQRDAEKPASNTTVAVTKTNESLLTSALNTLPRSALSFSPSTPVHSSQQGYQTHQALDTMKKETFASDISHSLGLSAAKDDASRQSPGAAAEVLSQSPISQHPVLVKPMPIVRTASTKSVSLRHPAPDLSPRSVSHASNIAQLEATAERLSMTSSIDDAIRELHDEQKRVDSRRSSILATSIGSIPENEEPVMFPITKQISVGSSIRETNTAARQGGYSPGGYVMSPNSSMVSGATRLRSGSISKSDADISGSLSRHGPGKSSIRSVRSITKPTLTNIAEIEPTTLTAAAMDEADRLAEQPEDMTSHIPHMQGIGQPHNVNMYYEPGAQEYWDQRAAQTSPEQNYVHDRPSTSTGSDGTYEQAERAFANFDGAHCAPEPDLADDSMNFESFFSSQMAESQFIPSFELNSVLDNKAGASRPLISRPIGLPTVQPKSYIHPETGESMLYYPARVPMMLNMPQKLSKKPKGQVRAARKSQVPGTTPSANRQSVAPSLPEFNIKPLLDPLEPAVADLMPTVPPSATVDAQDEKQLAVGSHAQGNDGDNRMSKNPKRGSQMPDLDNLPPQLRASAYFELPSQQLPPIQLKDGSATTTLEEILNASANAPVSAFTDHAFAGSLGTEVYGAEKKRKSQMKITGEAPEAKNRGSIFHIRKSSRNSQDETQGPDGVITTGDRRPLTGSADGEHAPEDEDGEEGEESEEPAFHGPPTTLLAELQMRKYQQKLRTRPPASAFPNGMQSTLLEMDIVAEVERRTRKGKKVNLAWENPDENPGESDDEDTPLGILFAAKGQEAGLVGPPRPLGLMERRDMEDNEPLSVRRNRLQGRETGPIQRMTLVRGLNMNPALRPPSPEVRVVTPEGDEIENETLGERMRRLKAQEDSNLLPQARPVSLTFSAELFSQLGDTFKTDESETKDSGKGKKKGGAQRAEEDETLGQRRRRLQAEREASEREMTRIQLNGGRSSVSPHLSKRHSMADILGGYGSRTILSDPRADAERARQEHATRYKEDRERKLAALRHQMPSNLSTPNLTRPGGFMSGRFNDGAGGGYGQPRDSSMSAFGNDSALPNHALNASAMGNAFRAGGAMSAFGPAMTNYASPYSAPQAAQSAHQVANIERWRQDVS